VLWFFDFDFDFDIDPDPEIFVIPSPLDVKRFHRMVFGL
jgi:hypothetical protein